MTYRLFGVLGVAAFGAVIIAACSQMTPTAKAEGEIWVSEPKGLHTAAGEGEIYYAGPNNELKIEVLLPPEYTNGLFDVIQETHFEGFQAGLHHHPTASETFYIVKGHYTWTVGNEVYDVRSGDTVYIPPNTTHFMTAHEEGIVNMTYMPSGLVARLRMAKEFADEVENEPGFRGRLAQFTGHIQGPPTDPEVLTVPKSQVPAPPPPMGRPGD